MADLIAQYARHLQVHGHPEATIETYVDLLRRLDRDLRYGLARACAQELIDAIYIQDRKPATKALYRAAARGFFRWAAAAEDGPLDFDPTGYLPPVKVPRRAPRPAETEQLHDILTRAREPERTWFLLAAGAGLRCVEISRLDREHVTKTNIWVQGKGGKERTVRTRPAVWAAVSQLPPGPVARMSNGERATRKQVRDRGNRVLQKHLGVPVSMHRLRHYFGTWTYRAQGEFVAQQLLGHASPATTAMYALVASEAMAAAVLAVPLPGINDAAADGAAA